jgi:hypothetical protein
MKKVVSVLAIMAVFSTAVFAAPLSLAGSLDTSSREGVSGIEAFSDFEDLFADVQAVALTDSEAQAVEGEGIVGGFLGFSLGFAAGALSGYYGGGGLGGAISGGIGIGLLTGAIGFTVTGPFF